MHVNIVLMMKTGASSKLHQLAIFKRKTCQATKDSMTTDLLYFQKKIQEHSDHSRGMAGKLPCFLVLIRGW